MNISTYTLTDTELTEFANKVKETFMNAMLDDGAVDIEDFENTEKYAIVVAKKGFFGKLFDKLWGDSDTSRITVVKVIQ